MVSRLIWVQESEGSIPSVQTIGMWANWYSRHTLNVKFLKVRTLPSLLIKNKKGWFHAMITLNKNARPIETETNSHGCVLLINRYKNEYGYVVVHLSDKKYYAHRLSYEQNIGKIPSDMIVRHKCDNPSCINPKHLELGTHSDNVQDRVNRNRSAKGEHNGRAKLTEQDVYYIKYESNLRNCELAKMFSVDAKTIRSIKQNKIWKHI